MLTLASVAQAQVQMDGNVSYFLFGSKVTVYMEEVQNLSDTKTGTLRIRVYATTDHWDQLERGHLLGSDSLPRLRANSDRFHLRRSMRLHRPDPDWYYVTVVVEERVVDETGSHWVFRDSRESSDRMLIARTAFPFFLW